MNQPSREAERLRKTIGQVCADRNAVERPCPHRTCRYYAQRRGKSKNRSNCVLDVVDENTGGMTLEEIGEVMGVSHTTVAKLEKQALSRIQPFFRDRMTLIMHLHVRQAG